MPDGEQGLLAITRPWPGMLRTLFQDDERYQETYFSKFGDNVYFVGDAARKDEDGYFWIVGRVDDVVNVSGPPALDGRGGVGDRLAPEGGRGGGDRAAGRGHRPGHQRVRDPGGGARRAASSSSRRCASTWRGGSASWRAPSGSSGPPTCRRRAPGRSCGGCCATSPRAVSSGDVTTLREPGVMKDLEAKFADDDAV